MRHIRVIRYSIKDRRARYVAFCVALIVDSCLIAINQGIPLLLGEPMTFGRWISVFLTPIVPFFVSCHSQGMKMG